MVEEAETQPLCLHILCSYDDPLHQCASTFLEEWPLTISRMIFSFLWLLPLLEVFSQKLKGVYIKDGRSWKSVISVEESPNFNIAGIQVPNELAICVRYYAEFENGDGWLQIWTKVRPICSICPGIQLGVYFALLSC